MTSMRAQPRRPRRVLLAAAALLGACFNPRYPDPAPPPDAGPKDAHVDTNGDGDSGAQLGPQHPNCTAPLSDAVLKSAFKADEKAVNGTKPNAFLDLVCQDDLLKNNIRRCDKPEDCALEGFCLRLADTESGFCVRTPSNDFNPALLSYRTGVCHATVDTYEKAALCCAHPQGLDCRRYPFAAQGVAGMFCASTADCQSGLVCRAALMPGAGSKASPLGICQCPEATFESQTDPAVCAQVARGDWGEAVEPLEMGSCSPALDAAFVQEIITAPSADTLMLGTSPANTVVAPSGSPLFLVPADSAKKGASLHLIARPDDMPKVSPATKLSDYAFGYALYDLHIARVSSARLAMAADGSLHIAMFTGAATPLAIWASDGSKAWHKEDLDVISEATGSTEVADFLFDAMGREHVLVAAPQSVYLERHDSGWQKLEVCEVDNLVGRQLLFDGDGNTIGLCTGDGDYSIILFDITHFSDPDSGKGAFFEPLLSAVYGGGTMAVATYTPQAVMHLSGLDPPGPTETIWKPNPLEENFTRGIPASMFIDAKQAVSVAHSTPQGLSLTRKNGNTWSTQLLTHDDGSPTLRLDAAGKVEIYYYADGNWDGVNDHIRRLREGTCPP